MNVLHTSKLSLFLIAKLHKRNSIEVNMSINMSVLCIYVCMNVSGYLLDILGISKIPRISQWRSYEPIPIQLNYLLMSLSLTVQRVGVGPHPFCDW